MPELMTAVEVAAALGISRVHVWRKVKAGALPAPIYAMPKSPRWLRSEIRELIDRATADRKAAA